MRLCSVCGKKHERKHPYCLNCNARYARENRPTHSNLPPLQKKKAICRSYANVYLKRGLLEKKPCKYCGDEDSQMHHDDYDKPLEVDWVCRFCHLSVHRYLDDGKTAGEINNLV